MKPRPLKLYLPLFTLLVASLLSAGPAPGQWSSRADASPSQQSLQVVDSLRSAGDFRTALARLYELSQKRPESVQVRWRYAILWSDYGKSADDDTQAASAYRQGLEWADRALTADPNSAWAHLSKADVAGRAALPSGSNQRSLQLSRQVKDHADRAIALDSTLAPPTSSGGLGTAQRLSWGSSSEQSFRPSTGGSPDRSVCAAK